MSKSAGHQPSKIPQKRTVQFQDNEFTAFDDMSSVGSAASPLSPDVVYRAAVDSDSDNDL